MAGSELGKSGRKTIFRAYKTELELNNIQKCLCIKHVGCARFAFNWGLQRKIEEYERIGKMPSAMDLHRELNQLKKTEFPWMYEVSKCAPQEALRNLDYAFRHFFRRIKKKENPGFPKFKSRKRGRGSFRLTGVIRVFHSSIQLPRLGLLRLKERDYLPHMDDRVHVLSATVSEKAGRWFVSLQVKEEIKVSKNKGSIVGVDLGVRNLATVSDGTIIQNPKVLSRYERKLKRTQRSLERKRKGSSNRRKIVLQLQELHSRIANIRGDVIHKATTYLTKTKSVIAIENLSVRRMQECHSIAKSVTEACFNKIRQQLEYKSEWYGSDIFIVSRFFPSTKRCSKCGTTKSELSLSTRIFKCEYCGLEIDRDLNASYNLVAVAVSSTETQNACLEVGGCSLRAVPVDEAGTELRIS
ncbi:MAG: RNA-guided endonuclease InsQ/TnpB family protein [Promethearchaeota archaeon]